MKNVIKTTILIILATSLTFCCNGKRDRANTEACADTEQVKPSRFPEEISDPTEALNLISKSSSNARTSNRRGKNTAT